jgi:hypothetical protein
MFETSAPSADDLAKLHVFKEHSTLGELGDPAMATAITCDAHDICNIMDEADLKLQ